ncbi:cytochrome C [Caulobacter sp. Root1455]|jgi:mono/diheme cytochrome c family protein|uniref:c-type cytochrome n=1 Tax=unclassified Caulobacter TaxID=2648921 RepID=UPI0006FE4383|nr:MULTISPECIES: cytochrome c [unclassified Caulobacter]KQY29951.1 cytochrome C [Caulobacter sp. Root487D2Y]KQY92250.1 cytochrome C [Caulobacter sp. Root1455]
MIRARRRPILAGVLAAGGLAFAGASLAATSSPDMTGGRGVAQRNCGGCHAVADGASRLADAPPFRDLWRRYPKGRLDLVLEEGMLRPSRPPEEGSPRSHPRMPMADLGDDEVAALRAYLLSLDPRR